ncbi:MAG TPA: rhodanese-like domain-containing protein [Bacillota bacterium]|nr:rhodanese-like domain-containing protein [Bacillota bacterium]
MFSTYKEHSPQEVMEMIKSKEDIEIIDVRESEEWESGHIPTAKHIPLGELSERMNELDKTKETIMVCRSGNRSSKACQFLSQMGYSVINMNGGMMNWSGEVKIGK